MTEWISYDCECGASVASFAVERQVMTYFVNPRRTGTATILPHVVCDECGKDMKRSTPHGPKESKAHPS